MWCIGVYVHEWSVRSNWRTLADLGCSLEDSWAGQTENQLWLHLGKMAYCILTSNFNRQKNQWKISAVLGWKMLSKAEGIEQWSPWKSKAIIVAWIWCSASNLPSSQINTESHTDCIFAHTVESLFYWLVSSIERSRQVVQQRVSGLSENLETFSLL